jgi:hypothetical protein
MSSEAETCRRPIVVIEAKVKARDVVSRVKIRQDGVRDRRRREHGEARGQRESRDFPSRMMTVAGMTTPPTLERSRTNARGCVLDLHVVIISSRRREGTDGRTDGRTP